MCHTPQINWRNESVLFFSNIDFVFCKIKLLLHPLQTRKIVATHSAKSVVKYIVVIRYFHEKIFSLLH